MLLFFASMSLNKIEELLTLTLETESEKETKKDYRKHQQENKQGSMDGENKTSSKYIDCRQVLRAQIENEGKAETFCCGSTGLLIKVE